MTARDCVKLRVFFVCIFSIRRNTTHGFFYAHQREKFVKNLGLNSSIGLNFSHNYIYNHLWSWFWSSKHHVPSWYLSRQPTCHNSNLPSTTSSSVDTIWVSGSCSFYRRLFTTIITNSKSQINYEFCLI